MSTGTPTVRPPRRWQRRILATAFISIALPAAAQSVPARIDDRTFWQMIEILSEPGGDFRSDNFVSNETSFQQVIPFLQQRIPAGGVYVGVGPDQNFTYIAALQPAIAFVIDIRRQNTLQHLLYKAMIELASDRAGFLSLLFARPRPTNVDAGTSVEALMLAYQNDAPDSVLFERYHAAVIARLTKGHGFALNADDLASLRYVHLAFFMAGPDITYTFGRSPMSLYGRRSMPTYGELMVAADSAGIMRSYLASESNFRVLKTLEERNLIVPVTGDFAGGTAVRAVGAWVRSHGATVSVFYTSNVEQYLFQSADAWSLYYANVATMPLDARSVFIRAVFGYGGGAPSSPYRYRMRSATLLLPIQDLLSAVKDGRITSYFDVIQMSREFTDRGSI